MAKIDAAGDARLTLVLGGARSGKSRHAQALAMETDPPWIYVATAEIRDDEMLARMVKHRHERGEGWMTLEAPLDPASAIANVEQEPAIVFDCLTLWLSNLMLGGHDVDGAVTRLIATLKVRSGKAIIVSNEVGSGIVPDNKLGRDFRDLAGTVNQRFAAEADRVVLVVAGLPVRLKP